MNNFGRGIGASDSGSAAPGSSPKKYISPPHPLGSRDGTREPSGWGAKASAPWTAGVDAQQALESEQAVVECVRYL
jgi:hypothetical protein